MSYDDFDLPLSEKDRAGSRFISKVRKALVLAAIEAKDVDGVSQQNVADKLGVHRSVINRLLRGSGNLTLRSIGEIAWALGMVPSFRLEKRPRRDGSNVSVQPLSTSEVTSNLALDEFERPESAYSHLNAHTYVWRQDSSKRPRELA